MNILEKRVSRRVALRGLGVSIAAVPIVGCGGMALSSIDAAASDAATGSDAALAADAGADAASATAWASGGTAAMAGGYADPFGALPTVGDATCTMTKGPCHSSSPTRQDVSEGYPGLPMRLALRILDTNCQPVSGATVEIWHTRNSGLYSGTNDTGEFNLAFCTGNDADAQAHHYFRGIQTTDANGRVDFDSCFPGWYASRAIHIHMVIAVGTDEYLISQLFFPQDVITDIFDTHPDYETFGQPDTPNTSDTVLPASDATDYLLDVSRLSDGAMMASRTLFLRTSTSATLCSVGGMGGMMMP